MCLLAVDNNVESAVGLLGTASAAPWLLLGALGVGLILEAVVPAFRRSFGGLGPLALRAAC